jgi:hypothetical protein
VKRTVVLVVVSVLLVGYAFVAGASIDLSSSATTTGDDAPRTHDVSVRSIGDETTVTVRVIRNDAVILERDIQATDSFVEVVRLQGTGEFTVVVSAPGDSARIVLQRPERFKNCRGDVNLRFSVESSDIFLSTNQEPGQCIES